MEKDLKFCTIYIVRHGQAKANVEKIVAGVTDSPLTEEGLRQAGDRGLDLASVNFDVVFASDLTRAKRTAEIIVLEKKLAVNTTHLLRERNFGEWEGRPEEDFFKGNAELLEKLKSLSEKDKQKAKLGQGYESNEEISQRFITYLREIAATYIGKTVLIVTHGSMMRSLLMRLGYAQYDELVSKSIENTAYFVLESDGVDFFVKETVGVNKVKV